MASSYDVSSLGTYVKEYSEQIKQKVYAQAKTLMYATPINMGGIGSMKIPYLSVDPVMKSLTCGSFSSTSDVDFGQRTISTCGIDLSFDFCNQDLKAKFLAFNVKGKDQIVFEEELMNSVAEASAKAYDELFWKGNTSVTGVTNLSLCDGIYAVLSADTARVQSSLLTTAYTTAVSVTYANIDATIDDMIQQIPAALQGKNIIFFMSYTLLNRYMMKMKKSNLYNYIFDNNPASEYNYYGMSNIKLVGTVGLEGSNYIIGTMAENLVYGVDSTENIGKFEQYFDFVTRIIYLRNEINIGFNVIFPEYCIVNF